MKSAKKVLAILFVMMILGSISAIAASAAYTVPAGGSIPIDRPAVKNPDGSYTVYGSFEEAERLLRAKDLAQAARLSTIDFDAISVMTDVKKATAEPAAVPVLTVAKKDTTEPALKAVSVLSAVKK